MKVSVIMPAFNRELYIGSALTSLLRQRDAADLDIIVVDDGSTDGTVAAVRQIMAETFCVRLHSQPNMGISAARNAGLRLVPSEAELVTFLDSDDVSPAGRFAADLALFRADASLDLTYGLMTVVDRIDARTLAPSPDARQVTFRGIQLSAAILRRRTIDRVGDFDEGFVQGEDADFLLRLFEQRPKYVLSDTIAIYYRRHRGNATNDTALMRRQLLRAALRSAQRRRHDPALDNIPDVFDLANFAAFLERQNAAVEKPRARAGA